LQNSDIRGPRHLNERTRKAWDRKKEETESTVSFQAKQRSIVAKLSANHPYRRSWEEKHGPIQQSSPQS
jgi:hypothetical protein